MQAEMNEMNERFAGMKKDGLVGVTFSLRNVREATVDAVAKEVNRLYRAVDRGEETVLDFKDSRRAA